MAKKSGIESPKPSARLLDRQAMRVSVEDGTPGASWREAMWCRMAIMITDVTDYTSA